MLCMKKALCRQYGVAYFGAPVVHAHSHWPFRAFIHVSQRVLCKLSCYTVPHSTQTLQTCCGGMNTWHANSDNAVRWNLFKQISIALIMTRRKWYENSITGGREWDQNSCSTARRRLIFRRHLQRSTQMCARFFQLALFEKLSYAVFIVVTPMWCLRPLGFSMNEWMNNK